MARQVTITYFHHSGFSAQVGNTLMIFDYWRGEDDFFPADAHLQVKELQAYDDVFFFVSHDHPDHYDEVIFSFKHLNNVHYIVDGGVDTSENVERMRCGDKRTFGDLTVTAYDSTDRGISFYVEIAGVKIFHAGDLNLWHWREENSLRNITEAEERYYAAVQPLIGLPMDVAMFPLDPRMGAMYEAGANHFIMTCKPHVFIPMHWQGRNEIAAEFAGKCKTKFTEGLALTKPRERAVIGFERRALNIHVYTDTDHENVRKRKQRSEGDDLMHALRALEDNDPFAESDLPVDNITGNSQNENA